MPRSTRPLQKAFQSLPTVTLGSCTNRGIRWDQIILEVSNVMKGTLSAKVQQVKLPHLQLPNTMSEPIEFLPLRR